MRPLTRVLGGFAATETTLEQRNPLLNETILDGEIELPRPISCENPDPAAGNCFTPTPGIPTCTATGCCSAVCATFPECCTVAWDDVCVEWAFIACTSNNPEVIRVAKVVRALGVTVDSEINGVTVTKAQSPEAGGGGVVVGGDGTFRIVRSHIVDNEAVTGAGAFVSNTQPVAVEILNCRFEGNYASGGGAGIRARGRLLVANCVFIGNVADDAGGSVTDAAFNDALPRQIINCTFTGNVAPSGGAISASTGLNVRNTIAWLNDLEFDEMASTLLQLFGG